VNQTPIRNADDLNRRLIAAWSGIQQSVIDQAIDQWRVQLRTCVKITDDTLKTCSDCLDLFLHVLSAFISVLSLT